MSGPTRRLFIGLLPEAAVRDALVAHQRRWYWGDGLPTRPERLHLTLHFLGEVDARREQALRDALAGEDVAPFELVLRTPDGWSGGVAVLRPDTHAALLDLHT
ncbi:MAG: 2'-5' RNA ligase family protein, partial [Rhizobacter sp.]